MSEYYVSGCKSYSDDIATCLDAEAEFWTLYERMADGTSQGVIDLKFREDAEAALHVYSQRDALQQQVNQLAAENAALKSAFNPEVIPEEAVEAFTETAIMDHDWNDTGEWSWVENDTDVIRAVLEVIKPETPHTDAFLLNVQADGVEKFANLTIDSGKDEPNSFIDYAGRQALLYATQLRAQAEELQKGGDNHA